VRRSGRIAVIDDDASSRDLIGEVLELEGYDVFTHRQVSPDLHEIIESRPDLLLVDLRLATTTQAELTGWDIVRLSKANRDLFLLPVLIVSADLPQLRSLIPAAMEYRNVLLLGKPFALDALSVMVRLAIEADRPAPHYVDHGDAPRPTAS
jgi:DNA-binding response OmpR family regulator